jgi:hypothetical protein
MYRIPGSDKTNTKNSVRRNKPVGFLIWKTDKSETMLRDTKSKMALKKAPKVSLFSLRW